MPSCMFHYVVREFPYRFPATKVVNSLQCRPRLSYFTVCFGELFAAAHPWIVPSATDPFAPPTPKSYKLYVAFHRLVQRISTVFTKSLDCFYEEARLFLRRSSTVSTKKLDYFYVEAQLFLRRCSTNCLKDLYKSFKVRV